MKSNSWAAPQNIICLLLACLAGCVTPQAAPDKISQMCLAIEPDLSSFQPEASLVVSGAETYILDGASGEKIVLPSNPDANDSYLPSNFILSPDYQKIAYIESRYQSLNGQKIFVGNALKIWLDNGEIFTANQWQPNFEYPIEWFDNDRLLLPTKDDLDGTIILYNPVTGASERIQPTFPDIYKFDPIPWYQSTNPLPLYNQEMTRVFYLRFLKDDPESNLEYVLYDLESAAVLWTKTVHLPTICPQWTPAQDQIIIASQDSSATDYEFFSIDQNGNESKLSDFSSRYTANYIEGFRLSPDGQKVGFWLDGRNGTDEAHPHFAIFDLATRQTTDYCLGPGGRIFWSPDGNQVAFMINENDNPEASYTVVLDVKENKAARVADHLYPVGWFAIK